MPRVRALGVHTVWNHPTVAPHRDAVKASASPALRALLEAPTSPRVWIDEALQLELHHHVFAQLGLASQDARIAFLSELQREAFRALYRTINIGSPGAALARMAAVWRHGHDTGAVRMASQRPKEARFLLENHPFLRDPVYRAIAAAGGVAFVELAGGRDVEVEVERPRPDVASITLRWR
ncbi:MAG TPA: DUF2378 family protein [Polyangiaceae bacterium LLY-WYZ-15_(1-7)]|nr:hypothetical protein [Myxococcales bacterium]MAT28240.1 hypothetical protein [Sandaracinus sp.]HJK94982.1 DUF2378 family protein [Polyangiaceae bacterium LLY-WYZ-15_(1-7)]HJL00115.1 DUF2378 family protein [Polyangiaceae bacterium LLY-WYZ-15_(1-7)]HJL07128.1 DUF2378 family protein [Polyangiaceae bacterium LLY-WYZ-15_(1-7)]